MAKKKTVKSNTTDLAQPQNRTEEFLAKIGGLVDSLPQGEFSRLERYLKYIAENGSGGGGVTSFNSRTGDVTPQSGDYTAAMVGARASDWTPSASDVGAQINMGFVEDTTYSGCFYRLLTGNVLEWLNPPLIVGTEYRTTERYKGKPVYVKVVNCGTAPANSYTITAHSVSSIADNVSCIGILTITYTGGDWNSTSLPYMFGSGSNIEYLNVYANHTNIYISSTFSSLSDLETNVTAIMKYTKTID